MRYSIGQVFETEGDLTPKRYYIVVRIGRTRCTVVERHFYQFRRRVCCDDPLPERDLSYAPFKMRQRDTGLSYGTTYLVPADFDSRSPFFRSIQPNLLSLVWWLYAAFLVLLLFAFYALVLWYFFLFSLGVNLRT